MKTIGVYMRPTSRRKFIASSVGTMGSLWMGCKTLSRGSKTKDASGASRTRKNLLELDASSPDIIYYKAGIQVMRNIPLEHPELGNLGWLGQANIHQVACAHRNYVFVPWHRIYLSYFEKTVDFMAKELRDALSGQRPMSDTIFQTNNVELPELTEEFKSQLLSTEHNFALPYWDWASSETLTNGEEQCPGILLSDPVLDVNTWTKPQVTRGIPPQKALDREIVGRAAVMELLTINDFIAFAGDYVAGQTEKSQSGALESGPHNKMHVWVGGAMGKVPEAGKDPAFWMHHCNIDRLWECWMQYHDFKPEVIYPDETHLAEWQAFRLNGFYSIPQAQPVEHELHETLNINQWDYAYDKLYTKEEIGSAEVMMSKGSAPRSRGMPEGSMEEVSPLVVAIKTGPAGNLVDLELENNSGKSVAVQTLKSYAQNPTKVYVDFKNLPEFSEDEGIDSFKFYFGFESPLEDWFYFASYTFFARDHHGGGGENFGTRFPLSAAMQKVAFSPRVQEAGVFDRLNGLRFRVAAFGRRTPESTRSEPIELTESQVQRFAGVALGIFAK
jgi:hypothetical protein